MKVHLDNIIYQLQSEGGISTFWYEITTRISEKQNVEVLVSKGSKLSRFLPVFSNSDIFHSSYFRTPVSAIGNIKTVVTVHDLIYEESIKTRNDLNIVFNYWQRRKAIENADAVVCISNTTKKSLLEYYPSLKSRLDRISVISHGRSFATHEIENLSTSTDRLEELFQEVSKNYVIFIGGRQNYKNFDLALKGFASSNLYYEHNYSFICTGKPFNAQEMDLISELQLVNRVKILANSTKAELIALYKYAHALLYISSQEGFGLPLLEAMACKCPIITSSCDAVLETVDDASIIVDVNDIRSIADAIDRLSDNLIRQSYISKGTLRVLDFDWDKSADLYLELYYSLLKS
jgi:glycosyltransferase involved in cell wall biosynthesis